MKVVVNARLLMKPYTGIGQFTRGIFSAIGKLGGDIEYVLLVPEEVDFKGSGKVRVEVLKERAKGTSGMKKTWWEQIQVPEYAKKCGADVLVCTYPCNPWSGDFYKSGIESVVVVHDCIPWKDKAYRRGLMSRMYHAQTKRAVRRAGQVVSVSEYSKSEIEKVCKVESSRISVIYNDVGEAYKRSYSDKEVEMVCKRFGIENGKYLLYVGGYDKRKNVGRLVELFGDSSFGDEVKLVLAGGQLFKGRLYDDFDKTSDRVVKTGFLDDEDLAKLYTGSKFFINLSKDEGFNIPALEAISCKADLVLSKMDVHEELFSEAAVMIDPDQNIDLAEINHTTTFSREKFLARFDWDKSARKMEKIILEYRK